MRERSVQLRHIYLLTCGICFLMAGFFFWRYVTTEKTVAPRTTTDVIIQRAGQLYSLPNDEKPQRAIVKEKAQLDQQPFFKNVQNGDDILIYKKHGLAIIYRSSNNTIVNAGAADVSTTH